MAEKLATSNAFGVIVMEVEKTRTQYNLEKNLKNLSQVLVMKICFVRDILDKFYVIYLEA